MRPTLWIVSSFALACFGIAFTGCSDSSRTFDQGTALEKEISGERAFEHVKALVELGPRPSGSEALEQSRLYLIEQLAGLGWETRRQTFEDRTPEGKVEFTNLRARFGEARWDRKVSGILCSHYDTKLFTGFEFVGANDGGSRWSSATWQSSK